MLEADGQKGALATAFWRVTPYFCLALLAIWLLLGMGGFWFMERMHARSLQAEAEQQAWVVADKIDRFTEDLRGIAENALTIQSISDPTSVEPFFQQYWQSLRIGGYGSLSISISTLTA